MTRTELTNEEKKALNHDAAYGRAVALRFLLETSEPLIRDFQASGGLEQAMISRIDKRQALRQKRLDNLSQPLLRRRLFGSISPSVPQTQVEPVAQTESEAVREEPEGPYTLLLRYSLQEV